MTTMASVLACSPSPSSFYNFEGGSFDQQEKVNVRLVENKGLVVELDGDDEGENESNCAYSSPEGSSRHLAYLNKLLPLHMNQNLSRPDLSLADLSAEERNKYLDCNYNKEPSPTRLAPFTRTRHGSTSGTGVSSLTPLMMKETHKIEVTIKPSASYIKSQRRRSSVHLCCALVFSFSAGLFFSLTLLLAKVLQNRDHHPISIAFWRYLGMFAASIPLLVFYGWRKSPAKLFGVVWPLNNVENAVNVLSLLMRAVLGSTAVILRFSSINYLTVADSSVISYCAPVFAAVFAPFCFRKEKGVVIPLCTAMVAIAGIFILCRPPFLGGGERYDTVTLKGVLFASLSAFCSSGVLLLLRNLLNKVHFSLILLVLGLWGTFEAGVIGLSLGVLKVPELLPDVVLLTGLAVLTFFGQLFILVAMQMGRMGSVFAMRSCDIFFVFLWQYLFLKTEPDIFAILGGTLVIFAVWLISFRKWVMSLRSNDNLRKKLSFLLV